MSENILNFNKKREENIEHKRRQFGRMVFNNFLGAYATLDEAGGLYPMTIVDISKDGCQIQVPCDKHTAEQFKVDDELSFRMYFTKSSYIPVFVKIRYGVEAIENGQTFMRYGCEFDKSVPSFKALENFIEFMQGFAEYSVVDRGDARVYFI